YTTPTRTRGSRSTTRATAGYRTTRRSVCRTPPRRTRPSSSAPWDGWPAGSSRRRRCVPSDTHSPPALALCPWRPRRFWSSRWRARLWCSSGAVHAGRRRRATTVTSWPARGSRSNARCAAADTAATRRRRCAPSGSGSRRRSEDTRTPSGRRPRRLATSGTAHRATRKPKASTGARASWHAPSNAASQLLQAFFGPLDVQRHAHVPEAGERFGEVRAGLAGAAAFGEQAPVPVMDARLVDVVRDLAGLAQRDAEVLLGFVPALQAQCAHPRHTAREGCVEPGVRHEVGDGHDAVVQLLDVIVETGGCAGVRRADEHRHAAPRSRHVVRQERARLLE